MQANMKKKKTNECNHFGHREIIVKAFKYYITNKNIFYFLMINIRLSHTKAWDGFSQLYIKYSDYRTKYFL